MSRGLLFWVLMLLWLVLTLWLTWPISLSVGGPRLVEFVLFALLGWQVFGPALKG
jgi:hypothetical protein